MTHHRVTESGQKMGRAATRLAELGYLRLEALGLININVPGARDEMCASCACQKDSVPNGCLQTQMDFLKAVAEGGKFLCHAPLDGRLCAGWVRARAEVVANPFPKEITDYLAKWKYSPPDVEENNSEQSSKAVA